MTASREDLRLDDLTVWLAVSLRAANARRAEVVRPLIRRCEVEAMPCAAESWRSHAAVSMATMRPQKAGQD